MTATPTPRTAAPTTPPTAFISELVEGIIDSIPAGTIAVIPNRFHGVDFLGIDGAEWLRVCAIDPEVVGATVYLFSGNGIVLLQAELSGGGHDSVRAALLELATVTVLNLLDSVGA
jgi:hypothetical protein